MVSDRFGDNKVNTSNSYVKEYFCHSEFLLLDILYELYPQFKFILQYPSLQILLCYVIILYIYIYIMSPKEDFSMNILRNIWN